MLRPYYVFSPEHETYSANDIDPPEYGCDVYQVEARTRREAIIAAVRLALRERRSWASGNRDSGITPFAGYRAELAVCGHGNPHFLIVDGCAVELRCWACDALSERAIVAEEASAAVEATA